MDESGNTTRRQRISCHGNALAKAGTVVCGVAMVLGFLVALVMHWFSDPDHPTPTFGMIFAGVLALFCVGVVGIVIGLILRATENSAAVEPVKPRQTAALHGGTSAEDSEASEETEAGSALEKKSWDEAFSSSRRRQL